MSICEKAVTCGNCCTAPMFEGNDYLKPEKNVLIKIGDKHPHLVPPHFLVNCSHVGPIGTACTAPPHWLARGRGADSNALRACCMPGKCRQTTVKEIGLPRP